MHFIKSLYYIFLLLLNIGKTDGLWWHEQSNLTDTSYGFPGNNFDTAEMMGMFLNQTIELESLKRQTEILKQQTENDRSSIQLLQNRVFYLEAELNRQNISKIQSTQEFSTYLSGMNQLTQNLIANEANNKNLTQQVNVALKALDDLKVEVRYTSLSMLDIHSKKDLERLNGSIMQIIEERINDVHDYIANVSRRIGFTASVSNSSTSWNNGTLVFPEVITNVGNGYNETNGVFTASIAGEYVFFVNVQSNGNQHIYVHIMLNGVDQVTAIAFGNNYNYYEAGGNLAVLTLQIEDRVWIEHYEGQGFHYDGHLTTFSGFLL